MRERLEPTLGSRIGDIVAEVLSRQRKLLDEALATLRLHYHGYAEALENRIFRQITLRVEGEEYDTLLAESLISDELNRELLKDLERRRHRLNKRLSFDLRSGIEDRIKTATVFKGLSGAELHDLATTTSLRFVAPQEVICRKGRRMRYVYFVSAGLAEAHIAGADVQFGAGDLIGAQEAVENWHCSGTVRAGEFGHLMAIKASRFRRLVEDYPVVLRNIQANLRQRENGERPISLLPRQKMPASEQSGVAARALLNTDPKRLAFTPSDNEAETD